MKKILPLGLALLSLSATAQTSETPSQEFPGETLYCISPNGEWAVGGLDGPFTVIIRNLKTGEKWEYDDYNPESSVGTQYTTAIDKAVSNDGIVIGEVNDAPAYWAAGKWNPLPAGDFNGSCQMGSITPDGSLIIGSIGQGASQEIDDYLFTQPCVWRQNADGTYGNPEFLPMPSRDLTNAIPQYFTLISASDDGKTLGALMTCNYGFPIVPYVFTDNNGTWSYKELGAKLINPENRVFPEFSGSYNGPARPNYEEYMTPEELAQYEVGNLVYIRELEASGEYTDDEIELLGWANAANYMSEPQKSEFSALWNTYLQAYVAWAKAYNEYEQVLSMVITEGMTFEFNNMRISPDGKYVYGTATSLEEIDNSDPENPFVTHFFPVRLDTATGESLIYANEENIYLSDVTADYSVLGSNYIRDDFASRTAYIFPQGKTEYVTMLDYFKQTGQDGAANWMEENMLKIVEVPNETGNGFSEEEKYCMGIPFATPDMSLLLFKESAYYWVPEPKYTWISFLLNPARENTGVENVAQEEASVRVLPGAIVEVKGEVKVLDIFDLSGAKVFSRKAAAGTIATGLPAGVYVVKADENTLKAVF